MKTSPDVLHRRELFYWIQFIFDDNSMLIKYLCVALLSLAVSVSVQAAETINSAPKKVESDSQQDTAAVLAALKSQKPLPGNRIRLDVPEIADSAGGFHAKIVSTIPATDWIALFDDKSSEPLATKFIMTTSGDVLLESNVKLLKTARLRAVVRAGGKFYEVSKKVLIAVSGCDD